MLASLKQLWGGLDRRAQTVIIGAGVLCIVALAALAHYGAEGAYAPLYTGLAPEDAAQIVEKLKAEKVPYRLEEGGGTLMVAADRVYELRIALAREGLPASGQVGFEIFDKSSLPGTQFGNQVNYQRALQGELSRTIGAMEEIKSARVHLVLPEESLFDTEQKASAAVVVEPESGRELTDDATAAIVHVVASAVRGITPAEVTVADTTGKVLHGPEADGASGAAAGNQLQIRQQYEEHLARSLQSMMDAVLGPSKAVVRVRADLDFDTQEVHSEALTPVSGGRGLVASEKIQEEDYQGGRDGAGGPAGLDANLSGAGATVRDGRNGSYRLRDESREYQFSRNATAVVKAPGRVRSLSVAAIIDEELPGTAEQQVRMLLAAAAGVNETRGDVITVQRMKISAAEAAKAEEAELAKFERGKRTQGLIHTAIRGGMGLVAAVILFLTAQTVMRQLRPSAMAARPTVGQHVDLLDEQPLLPGGQPTQPVTPPEPAAIAPGIDTDDLKERLQALGRRDAGAVADRLLAMLEEAGDRSRP